MIELITKSAIIWAASISAVYLAGYVRSLFNHDRDSRLFKVAEFIFVAGVFSFIAASLFVILVNWYTWM